MPIVTEEKVPAMLRPYLFHGLRIVGRDNSGNVITDCPFCGREGKFSIYAEEGISRCLVCAIGSEKGGLNAYTFLRHLWECSLENTTQADYAQLAKERKLLYASTPQSWGLCKSIATDDWLVPGFNYEGKLQQLYRYINDRASGKRKLLPTPELRHHLHGVNLYDQNKPVVCIGEGPWDAMAFWEVANNAKNSEAGWSVTGNLALSFGNTCNILAIPGCGSVGSPFERWLPLFANKTVYLLFDNDHPRLVNGRTVAPAAFSAVQRAVSLMAGTAEHLPKEVHYLAWGPEGYDPSLPSGYDLRDHLSQSQAIGERVKKLGELMERCKPVPSSWHDGQGQVRKEDGSLEIDCVPCSSWKVLINAWRVAMFMTEGLDRALSVMLASVASTKSLGDQLWVKILGPASSGKSTLCEALSVNRKYILAKSTIRGFHSGYKTDKDGEEDHSLIALVHNKTLVTKDGDTLLQSPNLGQILSEARDLYDSTSRTHYRHGLKRDYEGIRMTWILCGTSSLQKIDTSELGERFLDCCIMEGIEDEFENEVLWCVANKVKRNMALEADGKLETQHDPDLVRAMQLTGGYVSYLRTNAQSLLSNLVVQDWALHQCIRLGKFVAYMRARPSTLQEETAEREFAARLVSQLLRLAMCLSVVLNRKVVDKEVMRRVTRVAIDTASGRTLDIVKHLYRTGNNGRYTSELAVLNNQTEEKERAMLRFLRRIGVVETYKPKTATGGMSSLPKWRLTESLQALYCAVNEYALEGLIK